MAATTGYETISQYPSMITHIVYVIDTVTSEPISVDQSEPAYSTLTVAYPSTIGMFASSFVNIDEDSCKPSSDETRAVETPTTEARRRRRIRFQVKFPKFMKRGRGSTPALQQPVAASESDNNMTLGELSNCYPSMISHISPSSFYSTAPASETEHRNRRRHTRSTPKWIQNLFRPRRSSQPSRSDIEETSSLSSPSGYCGLSMAYPSMISHMVYASSICNEAAEPISEETTSSIMPFSTQYPSMIAHMVWTPELSEPEQSREDIEELKESPQTEASSTPRFRLFNNIFRKKQRSSTQQLMETCETPYSQLTTQFPSTVGMFASPFVADLPNDVQEPEASPTKKHSFFGRLFHRKPKEQRSSRRRRRSRSHTPHPNIQTNTSQQSFAHMTTSFPSTIGMYAAYPYESSEPVFEPPIQAESTCSGEKVDGTYASLSTQYPSMIAHFAGYTSSNNVSTIQDDSTKRSSRRKRHHFRKRSHSPLTESCTDETSDRGTDDEQATPSKPSFFSRLFRRRHHRSSREDALVDEPATPTVETEDDSATETQPVQVASTSMPNSNLESVNESQKDELPCTKEHVATKPNQTDTTQPLEPQADVSPSVKIMSSEPDTKIESQV